MGYCLLGFAGTLLLASVVGLGGGRGRLRQALARFGEVRDATEVQLVAALGPPVLLRPASAVDDLFDDQADMVADWVECGRHGGWHIALAFGGEYCLGTIHRNFQPVSSQ